MIKRLQRQLRDTREELSDAQRKETEANQRKQALVRLASIVQSASYDQHRTISIVRSASYNQHRTISIIRSASYNQQVSYLDNPDNNQQRGIKYVSTGARLSERV